MKVVYNIIFPFRGCTAMTVWPWIFVRKWRRITTALMTHERLHGEQQKEMLVVGCVLAAVLLAAGCGWWSLISLGLFFEWYVIEYIIRFLLTFSHRKSYRGISFEKEAYENQCDLAYLYSRKRYAWLRYVFTK